MGDTYTQRVLFHMNAHRKTVRDLKWGGHGWIYSGSADQTIKVWSAKDGKLLYDIESHTHWINSLTLSTDYILRTGHFNHLNNNLVKSEGSNDKAEQALYRYLEATKIMPERLVSGSDDTTMVIWVLNNNMIPNAKITGHQKPINYVCFSPDALEWNNRLYCCNIFRSFSTCIHMRMVTRQQVFGFSIERQYIKNLGYEQ